MLTNQQSKERDKNVVEFVNNFPCYSDTIAKAYYTSQRMANYHLSYLCEYGYIKRDRKHAHEKYFYYTGKPRNRKEHYDLIAKTYHWILRNDYKIISVKVQNRQDSIEPDMIVEIKQGNKSDLLVVEIERSVKNIPKTIDKYIGKKYNSLLIISNLPTKYIESTHINLIYNLNFKELE